MHVPTGVFVQGHYMAADFNGANLGVSGYWGQDTTNKKDADQWMIQAGITKNWTGLGNTSLYGEYSVSSDWGAGLGTGRNFSNAAITGSTTVNGVTDTELTVWGLGVVQAIDAAATELFLGWRHFEADITCTGSLVAGSCADPAGSGTTKLSTEAGNFVFGGARVKF
jgi:hypothetical protein